MLKHHAYTQLPRPGRAVHGHRLTVPDNLARIWLNNAVDDFHQRTLARAVLPQQGMNLAGFHGQINTVVGPATGVFLDDVLQFQALGSGHR